jgi:hypothetical protein
MLKRDALVLSKAHFKRGHRGCLMSLPVFEIGKLG